MNSTTSPEGAAAGGRLQRRQQRTRAALIRVAQALLAEDRVNASLLEITELADIASGSFYNYFATKEELFRAAVDDVLEHHGELVDRATRGIEDPAEVFACAFRLTGRLHRRLPGMSMVLIHRGTDIVLTDKGLSPRALRDIRAAQQAGRFSIGDPELALVAAGGAIIALGQLLHRQPERDAAQSADELTCRILQMFGLPETEARAICALPMPDLEDLLAG